MDEFENTLLVLFICMLVFVPLVLIWFRQGGKSESENAQKIRGRKNKLWQEWAATKNLTYHPPLGNPKREKINSGLNSDILNPQGLKQMVASSIELYTTEFDNFEDKVLGYFSNGQLSNDTDEPILSGQIATYPIVIGPTINGFGKKAYQGIRLCIQYPNPPDQLDPAYYGQTPAKKALLEQIHAHMNTLSAKISFKPGLIKIECVAFHAITYLDRLHKLALDLFALLGE